MMREAANSAAIAPTEPQPAAAPPILLAPPEIVGSVEPTNATGFLSGRPLRRYAIWYLIR